MKKTIYTRYYKELVDELVSARKVSGLTQVQVAARAGIHQSVMAKIETYDRRLDVVEFLFLSTIVGLNALEAIDQLDKRMRFDAADEP